MTIQHHASFTFPVKHEPTKKRGRPVRIKASFQHHLGKDFDFNLYIGFIENLIEKTLPADILYDYQNAESPTALRKVFQRLDERLPVMTSTYPSDTPGLLYINSLFSADYTHGVGRFMNDLLSRWVIPGKLLAISCAPSLNFRFIDYDKKAYFFAQVVVEIPDQKDLTVVKNNIPTLLEEAKKTVIAVKYARNIMALNHLSAEQKKALIQENVESLIDRPSKEFDQTIFDQMHQFLLKVSAEERVNQIKEKIAPLIEQRPHVFESDIFQEIQHFVFLFRDKFSALRDLKHTTRVITFQYLFRKALKRQTVQAYKDRPITFKILPTRLLLPTGTKPILGILVGMDVLRENEVFEQKHAIEAIQHCLPHVKYVKESFVVDRRDQDKVRLFYLEIEKESNTPFTIAELKELRQKLPRELKASIETVIHPVFMPRNEEEVMRNIVLLSQELKYVRDIPQVVISYDTQTETDLLFSVILLRVIGPDDLPLPKKLAVSDTSLRFQDFEIKNVGRMRKKYNKEASLFTVRLEKKPYLRKDYSFDLFKARQAVSTELSRSLGEIRDFNGGILSKQHELFRELRQSLEDDQPNEFLLENFFYSLTPPLMQTILPAPVLKNLFLMLLEAIEHSYKKDTFFLKSQSHPEYLLLIVASIKPHFKEAVLSAVHEMSIPSPDLCSSFLKVDDLECLGYIFRCEDPHQCALFHNKIRQSMHHLEKTLWKT